MDSSNPLREKTPASLKGIGEKTQKLFGSIGIDTLDQLIHYYPRAYDAYGKCLRIGELLPGAKQAVCIRVQRPPVVKRTQRTEITILEAADETGKMEVIWFHMPYLRSVLKTGGTYVLRGAVQVKGKGVSMEHPEIFSPEDYRKIQGSIQPIYGLTAGLRNKTVGKAVRQVLENYAFAEYLPEEFLEEWQLTDRQDAISHIHFPENETQLADARGRLVFDEFLFYFLKLARLGEEQKKLVSRYRFEKTRVTQSVLEALPFELTGAQKRVWEEIQGEMRASYVMNRLLQGDVGSGKTIIAFLAMLLALENGYQCALMAPTEVLAVQHYRSFLKLLKENGLETTGTALLEGSLPAKEKRKIQEEIEAGTIRAVIGTHALLQEKVKFANLALVITDEQHRFGVRQRQTISGKGEQPHVLVMSATPIPRTLALILYADMRISVLDELPASRLRIKNCVVNPSYRKTAYQFMEKEIRSGHQVYVICPMIEENEELSCENVFACAQKMRKIFPKDVEIGILHGRMSPAEKEAAMLAFSENRMQILVSTTVVEVGVDVPNATVMLIENAERFGLAQLHQLRGRIGRGSAQSYCIFMQSDGTQEENQRLKILEESNDGFYIAGEDLKLRGQGDLFGLRQSGETGFSLANPLKDAKLLEMAKTAAWRIYAEDPELKTQKYTKLGEVFDFSRIQDDGTL